MIRRLLQFPLRVWHRWIAPLFPPMCRFYPSCSVYAIEVLEKQPLHRAAWLIVRRVAKCHPFHPGGYDPAPECPHCGEADAEHKPGLSRGIH